MQAIYLLVLGISQDCPNVVQLAIGMHVDIIQPFLMNQLRTDCCNTTTNPDMNPVLFPGGKTFIVCNVNQRVTEINWYTLDLNGTINGTALPVTTTAIRILNNRLSGSIPFLLPPALIFLHLENNFLTGSIPPAIPSNLLLYGVFGNLMSGDLPIFPNSLQYLYLGYPGEPGNQFKGPIRLDNPIWILINDNLITDLILRDSTHLTRCDLSNNPLLGNPNIVNLTICTQNALYHVIDVSTATSTTSTLTIIAQTTISTNLATIWINATTLNPNSGDKSDATSLDMNLILIYGAICGLVLLCMLVVMCRFIVKHPEMKKSKFGRKNSYGTLNTVNSNYTTRTK